MKINVPVKLEGFVIYNRSTQMYSRGGVNKRKLWSKKPKVWQNIGHVKNHLWMFITRRYVWEWQHSSNGGGISHNTPPSNHHIDVDKVYNDSVVVNVATGDVVFECLTYLRQIAKDEAQTCGYSLGENCE